MSLSPLTAVSPVDGRYHNQTQHLSRYFSEYALIRYRIYVEIEYFIALCEIPLPQLANFPKEKYAALRNMAVSFKETDAEEIKKIEKLTNHDVKAVEYYLKNQFEALELSSWKEFIHFGLTSQDVNNTAVPLSCRDADHDLYLPSLEQLMKHLERLAYEWKEVPMLARTHGQPASPTRLGKEIMVFVERLQNQMELLRTIPYAAKFGGATGNFNAHHAAYPTIDWTAFADNFINHQLKLKRLRFTTQIEHYDLAAARFDAMKRINNILIDLCRDVWMYISMDYFKQNTVKDEVGSSAMPHKVNPIDFENAEGNLGVANALLEHLAAKLPVSRLQRDLTDSTVLRNVGVPYAHILISLSSIEKGLGKLSLNESALRRDLERNWAVVAEGIQTILRREGFPKPYEALKELTRGAEDITRERIASFIQSLPVSEEVKKEMLSLTPWNYTGIDLM
ncbi:MAG: adenylosuccinate lyase [Chitinophagales bacterium]|nr:adenylosuccinate lyase [Chitinophagales bacterium]MDW8419724.1 adenylosuccinate lyase [Chitinophagales bacterium]